MGGESFQLEEARRLIAAITAVADDLERDRFGTAVIHDDRDRALFDGLPMTATELRELASSIAALLLETENDTQ